MHETPNPDIKFNLDFLQREGNTFEGKGWILDITGQEIENLILSADDSVFNTIFLKDFTERPDVEKFYSNLYKAYGFRFVFTRDKEFKKLNFSIKHKENDEIIPVVKINNNFVELNPPSITVGNCHPSIMAVDNFYDDPDVVREFALSLEFNLHKEYHKGRRTETKTFFKGTKEFLEDALKKKITSWDNQPHNGVFQYCIAEDSLVYHTDAQTYAAVVFLTPDAPVESGTSFFQHKKNKARKFPTKEDCKKFNKTVDELYWDMFRGNFYDKTPWEVVDVIGNVYNRMAIWDAKLVHAASEYFGQEKEDARLFHMFFFDAI